MDLDGRDPERLVVGYRLDDAVVILAPEEPESPAGDSADDPGAADLETAPRHAQVDRRFEGGVEALGVADVDRHSVQPR